VALTGGAGLSAGGERWGAYPFGSLPGWAEAGSAAGPNSIPRPFTLFLFFSFSFFSDFYFLVTFAKELQIKSNMILKFSKIQNNLLKQWKLVFKIKLDF
jgi:hypothetical protein